LGTYKRSKVREPDALTALLRGRYLLVERGHITRLPLSPKNPRLSF